MANHDEEHLRRFLAARRRGDAQGMRRWWEELVVDFFDRMDGFVAAAHRGRLDADEHELAVAMSMTRFAENLVTTFDGVSMGQLVRACQTLARNICVDVQRKSMRDHRHEGPSLDTGWEADAEERAVPQWEAAESAARFEAAVTGAEIRDFLAWALPQIKEERRRVLQLTFYGAELVEIAEELDISKQNAYQRRTRGFQDLTKLKERYDA